MEKKTFMVVYTEPEIARGAYKVQAEDGIKASDIVSKALKGNYGEFKDSRSMVIEIPNGKIIDIYE